MSEPPTVLPLIDLIVRRVPRVPITQLLVGINVLVFMAMLSAGAGLWHSANSVQLAWGANFGPATQDGQWWRLGSALFLHFGAAHLAINMWALWDAGHLVERMYGHARFAGIYFVAGLSGNLLSLVIHGNQAVSGGASGAIFGVYGALLAFLWRERASLHPREFRWLFWGAVGFAAAAIALGLLVPGIDNAAHIGGFLAGSLAGAALAKPLNEAQRRPGRGRLLAGCTLTLAIIALVTRIPPPAYRWSDEMRARSEIGRFLRDDVASSRAWRSIMEEGRQRGASFEELAGRIDADVAERYEQSFEQLSQLHLDPALPSATTVETLRRYAEMRRDASRALAEGLRAEDPQRIRDALELARRSRQMVRPGPAGPKDNPH